MKALKTQFGSLVERPKGSLPPVRVHVGFFEVRGTRGQILIYRGYHRRAFNLIRLGRYEEAAKAMRILASIMEAWNIRAKQNREACLKVAAPEAPKIKTL